MGIGIDFVNEHYALTWEIYKGMSKGTDRLFRMAPGHVKTSLAISIGGTLRPMPEKWVLSGSISDSIID